MQEIRNRGKNLSPVKIWNTHQFIVPWRLLIMTQQSNLNQPATRNRGYIIVLVPSGEMSRGGVDRPILNFKIIFFLLQTGYFLHSVVRRKLPKCAWTFLCWVNLPSLSCSANLLPANFTRLLFHTRLFLFPSSHYSRLPVYFFLPVDLLTTQLSNPDK